MSFLKKVVLWSAVGLGMAVVFLLFWLNLPVQAPDLVGFMPEETFMFASLTVNPEDQGLRAFIDNLSQNEGGGSETLLKYGLSLCLPLRVAVLFSRVSEEEDSPYLILVQSPRLVKIAKILRIFRVSLSSHRAFAIFHKTLLISDNSSLVERTIDVYNKGEKSLLSGRIRESFRRLRDSGEIIFLVDNTDFLFSQLVDRLEDELSYTLLTSSRGIEGIEGYMRVIDEDRVRATLVFKYREGNDLERAEGDIIFLTGLLLRLCQANDLVLSKKVTVEDGNLKLKMEIFRDAPRNSKNSQD